MVLIIELVFFKGTKIYLILCIIKVSDLENIFWSRK